MWLCILFARYVAVSNIGSVIEGCLNWRITTHNSLRKLSSIVFEVKSEWRICWAVLVRRVLQEPGTSSAQLLQRKATRKSSKQLNANTSQLCKLTSIKVLHTFNWLSYTKSGISALVGKFKMHEKYNIGACKKSPLQGFQQNGVSVTSPM